MINGFSVFSNIHLKDINTFLNDAAPLPKKPSLPFDDHFVNDLKSYEAQIEAYFIDICNFLHFYLNDDKSNFNGRIKDAYYKIRNDYKEYRSYIRKAKRDYNDSRQIDRCFSDLKHDGSMSPSNPFYNVDDESCNVYTLMIEPLDGYCFLEDDGEDTYINQQLKSLKKLVKVIKKRNKRKLTKNQRKKLKKKLKLDTPFSSAYIQNESTFEICESDDPQVMIQDFFKRYAETGEWSWSIWNRYIIKIQQTNPVWFDIFNRYSYEMGINWNAMFTSDVNAQTARNVRIEIPDSLILSRKRKDNSLNFNPDEGKSVIFTPDVQAPSDDTNLNDLYCVACKNLFKSRRAFHIHLRGVKHIQNEINYVKDQKPERFITEVEKENCAVLSDITKEEKHFKWLLYNEDNSRVPGNYFCTICKVTCTSHKDLLTHLNGQKHLSQAGPDSIDVSLTLSNISTQNTLVNRQTRKIISRIQIILNTCTQPLIGLNYVTEYQRRDQLIECKYLCDLCKVKFERKSFIQHVVSQKHREVYLKYAHQDLYDILRHDLSSRSVKLKRLEIFAQEVENFEGRKKVNIMMEKVPRNGDLIASRHLVDCELVDKVTDKKCQISQEVDKPIEAKEILHPKENVFVKRQLYDFDDLDMSDTDDKEDGEVESSDEDGPFNKTEVTAVSDVHMDLSVTLSTEELEAGEIENNWSDREVVNDSEKEAGELEDEAAMERTEKVDLSEFDNYELIYNSEQPSTNIHNVWRKSRRITFIQQKDKRFRLKEVTPDIIEYFKQEAIWALNGSISSKNHYSRGNVRHNMDKNKRDLPGALLLAPMSEAVGPVYTGASSSHYWRPSSGTMPRPCPPPPSEGRLSPEIEFSNIIGAIESVTGVALKAGVTDAGLLQRVQDSLVNRDGAGGVNEVIRARLLTPGGHGGGGGTRRHLLPDPVSVDLDAINESLASLQNLCPGGVVATAGAPTPMGHAQRGDRLARRADFLGLDQPPPPLTFPRPLSPDHPSIMPDSPDLFLYHNTAQTIYPFLSPGMIEHHQSFAMWKPSYRRPNPLGGTYHQYVWPALASTVSSSSTTDPAILPKACAPPPSL